MTKKWPLHPKPHTYQLLYSWVEDLAKIYGVSYKSFCKNVLELTHEEISNLRTFIPEKALIILAKGTGIPIADLSTRNLSDIFVKQKQAFDQAIKENADVFAPWLSRSGIKF